MRVSREAIEQLAYKFRAEMGLGATEAVSVKSLLRRCNILTVYRPLSENAYGLSLKSPQADRFMLVNSNNSRGRQHFTIAHELYHLYYDKNPRPHLCGLSGQSKEEKEADIFASALLMPRDGVLAILPADVITTQKLTLAHVLRLEQYFQVSRSSMLYRLRKLSLISEATLQELLAVSVKESARQYGYDMSLYERGNENLVIGDYGEKARLLFEQEKISEGHYEELLNRIDNGRED